jgi:hypothetical protein
VQIAAQLGDARVQGVGFVVFALQLRNAACIPFEHRLKADGTCVLDLTGNAQEAANSEQGCTQWGCRKVQHDAQVP